MNNKLLMGIDLGATELSAGLVSSKELVKVRSTKINPNGSTDEILNAIFSLIDKLQLAGVSGIGIGVPSVVDTYEGIVYDVQNIPSWKRVPVKAILEERYFIPVFVNNDANCFALGEKYYGKGIEYSSLIGLILGTGFGGGVIIDNKLYSGGNCGAGEFGMLPYKDSIFEYYCSGQFFTKCYHLTGKEVQSKAENGDEDALKILTEFGKHLGNAIKAILYVYDPEIIILGGSVRKAFQFFQEPMWRSIETFAYSNTIRNLKIEISENDYIAILGAAALYHDASIH